MQFLTHDSSPIALPLFRCPQLHLRLQLGQKDTRKYPARSQLIEQSHQGFSAYIFCTTSFCGKEKAYLYPLPYACGRRRDVFLHSTASMQFQTVLRPHSPFLSRLSNARARITHSFCSSYRQSCVDQSAAKCWNHCSIPTRLQLCPLTPLSEALSIYGVLNGMALPCILFPSAITSSVSVMLLPTVAELQAAENRNKLRDIVEKIDHMLFPGTVLLSVFSPVRSFIRITLFGSKTAGRFLVTLAWICLPYTQTALF